VSRYTVEKTLGRGGMATVELAHDTELDRRVAVKRLFASLADDAIFRRRFLREARMAAALSHPNLVAVFDVGDEDGLPYIVMEYVDGETLADLMRRTGPMPPDRAVDLLLQVCAGLQHAHAAGLVHRDIKPQNLLVRSDGTVKIADFGIARTLQATQLTQIGTVLGTAAYLAPEQAAGERVTAAADIYSLGAVGYELLSGRTPYEFASLADLALQQREPPAPPPGASPELASVILRPAALGGRARARARSGAAGRHCPNGGRPAQGPDDPRLTPRASWARGPAGGGAHRAWARLRLSRRGRSAAAAGTREAARRAPAREHARRVGAAACGLVAPKVWLGDGRLDALGRRAGGDALTGQRELHLFTRLVDAPLDGGERDLERVGDLRVGEADDVPQEQRHLEIDGEVVDSTPHRVHCLDALDRCVEHFERRRIVDRHDRARPALARPHLVEHAVLRHLEEPGREPAPQRELRETLVHPEENLLREVLGERAIAAETQDIVVDRRLVRAND
jgi:serine/threonine protein kinase